MEYYEKKEKQVELQKKIQSSNMLNQARLKVLKVREDHVRSVLEDARLRLGEVTKNTGKYTGILESLILQGLYQTKYAEILENLILQGLYQLFERDVIIRVRPQDRELVKSLVPTVTTKYKDVTGRDLHLKIDDETQLSQDTTGGIELLAQSNKIKISNTLEARLDLISQQLVPQIRNALFGRNVNRKFTD